MNGTGPWPSSIKGLQSPDAFFGDVENNDPFGIGSGPAICTVAGVYGSVLERGQLSARIEKDDDTDDRRYGDGRYYFGSGLNLPLPPTI